MKSLLQINGQLVHWAKLHQFKPSTPFEKSTIDFIQQWLSEVKEFNIHTSGSTGKPKKINISRLQMEISARLTIDALKINSGQTALVCLDTEYIAGKMMLVRAMINHMNIIAIAPSSNPLTNLDKVPDFAAVVPLQLEEMLNNEKTKMLLNKMSAIIVGGAPVSPVLERKLQQVSTPIYATYGMTETVSHVALKRLNGPERSATFTAFKEVKLALDDRGCLTIQSALTNHETLTTNDRVELISDHHFEWLGRADNIINSGGVKVQSEKVEKAVAQILDELGLSNRFFVTGIPDEKLGHKVYLVMESPDNLNNDKEKILSLLQAKLSRYEVPKDITLVPQFTETPTGKVNRRETIKKLL
ncbi:AMP-binding protein [Fulvivirga sp. 29W222]|uniref:AMP-binding protein n=1 Tax=Fulvivirga marina TaxID=2494733 RepID=A0A937KAS4_9BACT|nr:AMP-binding protein [Fulvivirga marina]MBL6445921.1 AMP-binding protein [Fulvivirga marina]